MPVFQSTPPARGATWTERHKNTGSTISIHAPREGGDHDHAHRHHRSDDFNPRPPRGGRLKHIGLRTQHAEISIHAPREGGDTAAPAGHISDSVFQSTPPARGATDCRSAPWSLWNYFNPRPPRGGRLLSLSGLSYSLYFNPRPPRGGATPAGQERSESRPYFNPRPPRGGRRLYLLPL